MSHCSCLAGYCSYTLPLNTHSTRMVQLPTAVATQAVMHIPRMLSGMLTCAWYCRRTECYQCSTRKPANPQFATLDQDVPSQILKVSGLEPQIR